mgnify:CR=1 FL=1
MVEEIRQDGKVILSSEDVFSVPMIFNNLCGKNFIGKEYKDYILSLIHISEPTRPY